MPRDSNRTVIVSAGRLEAVTDSFGWVTGEPLSVNDFVTAPAAGPHCGAINGAAWVAENCGWPSAGDLPSNAARTLPYVCENTCGNLVVEPGEECDAAGPDCTATCKKVRPCTEAGGSRIPGIFAISAILSGVRGFLGAGSRSALPLRFSVIFEYGG